MSTERCSSPRPSTSYVSGDAVSSTRSATFDFVSLNRRSRRLREVTNFPSLPAKGPLFDMNCILTVGSSISSSGRMVGDRKSTRLNSSHVEISYAVFCLKKKKKNNQRPERESNTHRAES